jgi:hypothetical protein
MAVVNVGQAAEKSARGQVGELTEAETMGKLVEQNSDEIVLRSVVVVEAQVEVDGCGEIRVDVVKGWRQIATRQLVCKGYVYCVPGKGAFGKSLATATGPALPRIPAPSGVNCARIRIGTLLSNRSLQMRAACANAINR